jgi:hypothetical protein
MLSRVEQHKAFGGFFFSAPDQQSCMAIQPCATLKVDKSYDVIPPRNNEP